MTGGLDDQIDRAVAPYVRDDEDPTFLADQVRRRLVQRRATSGKDCPVCREARSLRDFGPDNRNADGLRYACRRCEAERTRLLRGVV